jgi:hypothetical protein
VLPDGGLADPLLKGQVWGTVTSFYRNMRGCNEVTSSAIEVVLPPDSSGSWEEAWSILACKVPAVLTIKFTVTDDGGVYYDIQE